MHISLDNPPPPPAIKIKLKESTDIIPSNCICPYDTPFHLRSMYEKEMKNCLEAGILEKCGTEPSQWSSKAFPVLKGSGEGVKIVADFKKLTQVIERPVWPTESSSQLLRHRSPSAKYFISLDLTSGYHQVRVDQESQNLLCITTAMGRYHYTVLGQEITSASDIFNLLTDGDIRYSGIHAIKNMDDI